MVDLKGQLDKIRNEVDYAINQVLERSSFIQGEQVKMFESDLADWVGVKHVISCANGTDALQLALMALGLKSGDEVVVPAFTYVATAEVIALLGLKPILVDVEADSFNIDIDQAEGLLTARTKAIVPVHLFGQCADMDKVLSFAAKHNLFVVEDTAQAIGAEYTFADGRVKQAGTMGHIGTTSFFPSKNLGCFGDGGALFTDDDELAQVLRMIANHGQKVKYYHDIVGVNSRLDTIQAAILQVKLKYLSEYCRSRQDAALTYDSLLSESDYYTLPKRSDKSSHVFHQYTIKIHNSKSRDELRLYLNSLGIPSMVYYPVPLHKQKAYEPFVNADLALPITSDLCNRVLSLPMHTELTSDEIAFISDKVKSFFS